MPSARLILPTFLRSNHHGIFEGARRLSPCEGAIHRAPSVRTEGHSCHPRYVNYLEGDAPNADAVVYGPNLARLKALKTKYDPDNFFRHNVNILPK